MQNYRSLFGFILFLPLIPVQTQAQELEIHLQDGAARIRPLESVVLQVRAFQIEEDEEGNEKKVRVLPQPVQFVLESELEGWLSKPFRNQVDRFQGGDSGQGWKSILGNFGRSLMSFDSVLYTALEKPGTYRVVASSEGQTVSVDLKVTPSAPSRKTKEKTSFRPESSSSEPYRSLAAHWAPLVAQATWFEPKADYLARFDFDGDWKGDNNWENTAAGSSQAYVYYAAAETETHWFLIYNFFHPRDYSASCVGGTCHENDNEGLILTIFKDGTCSGRLQVMETLAHNNIYSYRADKRVKNRAHKVDGKIEFYQETHPVVFIESGGHGVYGSTDRHSKFSLRRDEFRETTGVTYIFGSRAGQPRHGSDREVSYELLPILDHWWRRGEDDAGTFAGDFRYQPHGKRPAASRASLPAAFNGRKFGKNKAKPFWGWHDRRTRKKKILATGQWGLDPAYGVSRNLKLPEPFSLTYIYNPYLKIAPGVRKYSLLRLRDSATSTSARPGCGPSRWMQLRWIVPGPIP